MAISHVVTRGYGNGTLTGEINLIPVRGYSIGEAVAVQENTGGYAKGWRREETEQERKARIQVERETLGIIEKAETPVIPPIKIDVSPREAQYSKH